MRRPTRFSKIDDVRRAQKPTHFRLFDVFYPSRRGETSTIRRSVKPVKLVCFRGPSRVSCGLLSASFVARVSKTQRFRSNGVILRVFFEVRALSICSSLFATPPASDRCSKITHALSSHICRPSFWREIKYSLRLCLTPRPHKT